MSAATLVFLGGRLRYFSEGAIFGVHQFSFRDPSPENIGRSQALSAKIAKYVADMQVRLTFLEISSSTANGAINILGKEELIELGVITGGVTEAAWTVQANEHILYVRGERDSLFGHHKVMLCFSRDVGFLFWAVIESQGREKELTGFSLVEITLNNENVRMDISNRCERKVLGIYVNVMSRISEDEARQIAFSESCGIQIRFSDLATVFLGVSEISTDGGRDQLRTFFSTLSGQRPSEEGNVDGVGRPTKNSG